MVSQVGDAQGAKFRLVPGTYRRIALPGGVANTVCVFAKAWEDRWDAEQDEPAVVNRDSLKQHGHRSSSCASPAAGRGAGLRIFAVARLEHVVRHTHTPPVRGVTIPRVADPPRRNSRTMAEGWSATLDTNPLKS